MKRTIGINRNRTSQLNEIKREKRFNKTLNNYASPNRYALYYLGLAKLDSQAHTRSKWLNRSKI